MVNQYGLMDQAELDLAMSKIGPRFASKPCPVCATDKWSIEPFMLRIGAVSPPGSPEGAWSAYLSVICRECSFTLFFNAVSLGVVPHVPFPEEAKVGEAEKRGVLSGDQAS